MLFNGYCGGAGPGWRFQKIPEVRESNTQFSPAKIVLDTPHINSDGPVNISELFVSNFTAHAARCVRNSLHLMGRLLLCQKIEESAQLGGHKVSRRVVSVERK